MIDEKRSETLRLERTLQRLFGETSYLWRKPPAGGNSGAITIIPSCSGVDESCLSARTSGTT